MAREPVGPGREELDRQGEVLDERINVEKDLSRAES